MSIKSAKAFIELIKKNEEFSKKLSQVKDYKAGLDLLKSAGFDFNKDELKEILSELTGDELKMVSGGCNWYVNDRPVVEMPYAD